VGKDRLVIKSSYTFQDNRGVPATHSFPELLVRYGVSPAGQAQVPGPGQGAEQGAGGEHRRQLALHASQ
jgi:hypothetical protein